MNPRCSPALVGMVALLLSSLFWAGLSGQASPPQSPSAVAQAASPSVTAGASPSVAPTPSPSPARPRLKRPRKPGHHPELYRALTALRVAKYALQKSPEEYGGRRASALKLVEQAEAEVKAALNSVKK